MIIALAVTLFITIVAAIFLDHWNRQLIRENKLLRSQMREAEDLAKTRTVKVVSPEERRERYEFLKSKISERHFNGYAGLTVDFQGREFDSEDIACFRPPMYQFAINNDYKWCIFWDRNRMVREIGTGAPLKEGEVLIPDTIGRTKPQGTVETIDEQSPLTQGAMDDSKEGCKAAAQAP